MHLRMPSIDQGVQAFVWALFFFVLLWVGMLALDVSGATALILSLARRWRDLPLRTARRDAA